jgi:predicted TIM-barrel fold metal-dependent hydrolase
MNLDELVAIDVHTHAEVSSSGESALSEELEAASSDYFKVAHERRKPTLDEIGAYYRSLKMAAVVFTVDAEAATGTKAVPNEEIAESALRYPDAIIPFASIDPAKGRAGARQVRRLVEEYGVRGFKFHPNVQAFYPNDRMAYPLYEAIEECGAISVFHTGQTGIGAGAPGGGGIRLKYSNPMFVDDVAVDFPGMKIILAHPSFPWQDEALSVATHKPQVYIDLSGWSPKYFPPQLVQYANSLLQDKVLFGTDYPLLTPERWLADFDKLPIKDSVRPKILKDNAARLLGLA